MQQMDLWPASGGRPKPAPVAGGSTGGRRRHGTMPGVASAGPATALLPATGTGFYRHPDANRSIVLDAVTIAYLLQRSRRRTIGFSVDALGLVIRAPQRTTIPSIESALREKKNWVVRKLREAREYQARLAAQRVRWRDGTTISYLGQPLRVRLDGDSPARGGHRLMCIDGVRTLHLRLPADTRARQMQEATRDWLLQRARSVLPRRLQYFAGLMNVRWRTLELSSARTRWGSASADGAIRLNWQLVQLDMALLDYVVVHELAHQHEMNHSPRFWLHVRRVLPDYAERRKRLREQLLQEW